ncbi:ABC transporter permease [Paenibacillus turicensis]|uniref:ABC transporter permease n=1 Tax=Paenibacillus turicensis TaxID=160487 RepID=UPI003D2BED8C
MLSALATRNQKELLRDPLSIVFGLALPIFLLYFVSVLQKSVPADVFKLENFAPSIAIFSFSFISLFSGTLLAKDRGSSFLTRLFASPLSSKDYILSYSLPLLFVALLQSIICLTAAVLMGLPVTSNLMLTVVMLIPISLLFIGIGLLFGALFTDKQVGGIFAVLVQVVALSSGMWFDLNLFGGAVQAICNALPFSHAVEVARATMAGNLDAIMPHMLWVLGYTLVIFVIAIIVFKRRMKED